MAQRRQEEPVEAVEEQSTPERPPTAPRDSGSEKTDHIFTQAPALEDATPNLRPVQSHVSTHDATGPQQQDEHYEVGDEIYNKFSHFHKITMVTVLSMSSFLAPVSSTSILAASPEVVATYNTTGAIFNISNALYMIFMGFSALVYGPLGTTYVSSASASFALRYVLTLAWLYVREENGLCQSPP